MLIDDIRQWAEENKIDPERLNVIPVTSSKLESAKDAGAEIITGTDRLGFIHSALTARNEVLVLAPINVAASAKPTAAPAKKSKSSPKKD